MIYLLSAGFFFLLFFSTHVLAFRLGFMKFQTPAFLLISLVWLAAYLLSLHGLGRLMQSFELSDSGFWGAPLTMGSVVLYLLLCLAYVAESNLVENDSPSLRIIKSILRHPLGKLTIKDLEKEFNDQEFIVDRLEDLVKHGHVEKMGELYHLALRGAFIAKIIGAYRQLIRKGVGG